MRVAGRHRGARGGFGFLKDLAAEYSGVATGFSSNAGRRFIRCYHAQVSSCKAEKNDQHTPSEPCVVALWPASTGDWSRQGDLASAVLVTLATTTANQDSGVGDERICEARRLSWTNDSAMGLRGQRRSVRARRTAWMMSTIAELSSLLGLYTLTRVAHVWGGSGQLRERC